MDTPGEKLDDLLAELLLGEHALVPNPFRRDTVACTGTELYSPALMEAKARTTRMPRWFRSNVGAPDDTSQPKIHYSDCTADCRQANTADIGLSGMHAQEDDEIVETMDVGVSGDVDGEPSFTDWIRQCVPADEVPGAVASLVGTFAEHRNPGQTFRKWVDAKGIEAVAKYCVLEEAELGAPYIHDAKQSQYPFAEDEAQSGQVVMSD